MDEPQTILICTRLFLPFLKPKTLVWSTQFFIFLNNLSIFRVKVVFMYQPWELATSKLHPKIWPYFFILKNHMKRNNHYSNKNLLTSHNASRCFSQKKIPSDKNFFLLFFMTIKCNFYDITLNRSCIQWDLSHKNSNILSAVIIFVCKFSFSSAIFFFLKATIN